MKKKQVKPLNLLMLALLLSTMACREEFDSDFREVLIINNPPEVASEIGEQVLGVGEERELDLAGFITDAENDPISYTVTTSDASVVTAEVSGSLLTMIGESLGSATISLTGSDGTEGNEVTTDFDVTVTDEVAEGPSGVFVIDFEVANGTAWEDLDIPNVSFEFDQDEGAVLEVANGVMEWSMDEFSAVIMNFDEPIDISDNPILQFDYADLWNEGGFISISDADGNAIEGEFGEFDVELIVDDPSFNTFILNLEDAGDIDFGAISSVFFEKFEGPGEWRFDNFILGPEEE